MVAERGTMKLRSKLLDFFQDKESLYDVYIDNQNMRTHVATLKEMSKTNSMDREKRC